MIRFERAMFLKLTSRFEVIDARFRKTGAAVQSCREALYRCVGPKGRRGRGGRYLVWSDIPNDRVMRWDETDGSVSVFRQPREQQRPKRRPQGR